MGNERSIPREVRAEVKELGGNEAAGLDALRGVYARWLLRKDAKGRYTTWGSHFEIAVFAHRFGKRVFVCEPRGSLAARRYVEVGEPVGKAGSPEVLLVFQGACHYNFLYVAEVGEV